MSSSEKARPRSTPAHTTAISVRRRVASSMSFDAVARRFRSAATATNGASLAVASAFVPFVVNSTADFPLNESVENCAGELP